MLRVIRSEVDRGTSLDPSSPYRDSALDGTGCRRRPDATTAESGHGRRDAALAGLSGSSVAERFRAWRGASGRRYVFSVFRPQDDAAGLDRPPSEASAVVIAAERRDDGTRTLLWIADTGPDADEFFGAERVRSLAARGECEVHLHLLAANAAERRAIMDDLGRCTGPER